MAVIFTAGAEGVCGSGSTVNAVSEVGKPRACFKNRKRFDITWWELQKA